MKLYSLSKLLSGSLILFSLTKRNDETTTTELNKTGYQYSSCLLEGFISFYFPSWSWVTSRGRSWVTNGSDDANIQKDDHDAHVSSLCLFPCTFLSLFPSFLRQEEEFLFNNPLSLPDRVLRLTPYSCLHDIVWLVLCLTWLFCVTSPFSLTCNSMLEVRQRRTGGTRGGQEVTWGSESGTPFLLLILWLVMRSALEAPAPQNSCLDNKRWRRSNRSISRGNFPPHHTIVSHVRHCSIEHDNNRRLEGRKTKGI